LRPPPPFPLDLVIVASRSLRARRLLKRTATISAFLLAAAPVPADQTTNNHQAMAMGFDQDKTAHHFRLYTDGGAIEVGVIDATDTTNRDAMRSHLPHIAAMFGEGNFDAPMLLKARDSGGAPCAGVRALVASRLDGLTQHIADLRVLRKQLQGVLAIGIDASRTPRTGNGRTCWSDWDRTEVLISGAARSRCAPLHRQPPDAVHRRMINEEPCPRRGPRPGRISSVRANS